MPHSRAALLLLFVILAWGMNWTVNKSILDYLPPLWATALRTLPACAALWLVCMARGGPVRPRRDDIPVILGVGLLHMVGFSVLASLGLQFLPAGRSVVLAYTTPLWVLPAARLWLGEPLTGRRLAGLGAGLAGLALLLQPQALDWQAPGVAQGHALILAASLSWGACIVIVRARRSATPAFDLLPWQLLMAAGLQSAMALSVEGLPKVPPSWHLAALLLYSSLVGTVLAYWAMNIINRELPASLTSMALLGVPVAGLVFASVLLGEALDGTLLLATSAIVGGIALSAWRRPV